MNIPPTEKIYIIENIEILHYTYKEHLQISDITMFGREMFKKRNK
jgi:hypothetical protein